MFEQRIGDRTALADEDVDELTDAPELAWVASALATPALQEERNRAEGLIVFAPWDAENGPGTDPHGEASQEAAAPCGDPISRFRDRRGGRGEIEGDARRVPLLVEGPVLGHLHPPFPRRT